MVLYYTVESVGSGCIGRILQDLFSIDCAENQNGTIIHGSNRTSCFIKCGMKAYRYKTVRKWSWLHAKLYQAITENAFFMHSCKNFFILSGHREKSAV